MPVAVIFAWFVAFDLAGSAVVRHAATAPAPVAHICDAPELDLDGDGLLDDFVAVPDSCGTGGCVYTVSLSGDSDHDLGVIDGCWFQRGTKRHHGLFDVIGIWRLGTDAKANRFRFDGRHYRRR